MANLKKKINIVKILMSLHSENGSWTNPKTSWNEKNCHIYDTKKVDDKNHSLEMPCTCPRYLLK
jgi:hypothetical protein